MAAGDNIQQNLGWVAPRESRQSSTGCRDNSHIVLIGRPFAFPYLWIPAHLLCAAAKPEASAT